MGDETKVKAVRWEAPGYAAIAAFGVARTAQVVDDAIDYAEEVRFKFRVAKRKLLEEFEAALRIDAIKEDEKFDAALKALDDKTTVVYLSPKAFEWLKSSIVKPLVNGAYGPSRKRLEKSLAAAKEGLYDLAVADPDMFPAPQDGGPTAP